MRIAELFYSIQGEGKLAGVPSAFIRTAGCHLRCRWCDTPYALDASAGRTMTVDDILREISAWPARHAVITGGEPFLQPDIVELTETLHRRGTHITVETSGTDAPPVACDLMSISPKLGNSTPSDPTLARQHEHRRLHIESLRELIARYPYQLKFVLRQPADLEEVNELLTRLGAIDPADVLLMPEGTERETLRDRSEWIIELCKARGFRYCPRLQVELYGNRRGV